VFDNHGQTAEKIITKSRNEENTKDSYYPRKLQGLVDMNFGEKHPKLS
jgi:hypothetical protein